jgi:hypothetical protein
MEWEEKYPLTTVQALTREFSDHTLLLLNSGEPSFMATQPMFKFELGWLLRDGFIEMVKDIWEDSCGLDTNGKMARKDSEVKAIFKKMGKKYKWSI